MTAPRLIGRVGGLAVALGVGGIWAGHGVASADDSAGPDSTSSGSSSSRATHAAPARPSSPQGRRGARAVEAARTGVERGQGNSNPAAALPPRVSSEPAPVLNDVRAVPREATTPGVSAASPQASAQVESAVPTAQAPAAAARPGATPRVPAALQVAAPVSAQAAAAPAAAVSGVVSGVLGRLLDAFAGSGPAGSTDSPLSWALLAAARRHPLSAVTANATAGQTSTAITTNPQTAWVDGVLMGTLNAVSPLPLSYKLVSTPSLGGKLGAYAYQLPSDVIFGKQGEFTYLPYVSTLTDASLTETFKIRAAQTTKFDTFVTGLPIVGLIAPTIISAMQQTPILNSLLAPLIGSSTVVTFTVNPYALANGRPTALTAMVESFDGLMLSTNYFPALNVARGEVASAPTVFNGPGLGAPGNTDIFNPLPQLEAATQFGDMTPGLPVLRSDSYVSSDGVVSYDGGGGYNVITWDPRGEFASIDRRLPGLQMDNPFYEGRDASAILSWAYSSANPAKSQVAMETPTDPLAGMVGGSYGGGIQWVTAGTDPRVDVIAPEISWNSLISSLYPNTNQFKAGFGTLLTAVLVSKGADINKQIYQGVTTGILFGRLNKSAQAVVSSAGPTTLLDKIDVPALIVQGMQDGLFTLQEAVTNAEVLLANPTDEAVKMVWFCGGHGTCNDPVNPYQEDRGLVDNLKWLDQYLAGDPGKPADTIPTFQWYDQLGVHHTSTKLPFEPGFNKPQSVIATGKGGVLGIVPILGGSGTISNGALELPNGTKARNAINVAVTPPPNAEVVGAPNLSFAYTGIGTTRTLYAQLVDNATGRVLGNIVTPIPVEFDGRAHTVTIPMAEIGYTGQVGGSLTLQITSSATNFENFTTYGVANISDVRIELPVHDPAV